MGVWYLVKGVTGDNGEPWEDDAGLTVVGHEVVVQELLEEGGDYGDTGDAGKHGEEGGDTGEHGEERNTSNLKFSSGELQI